MVPGTQHFDEKKCVKFTLISLHFSITTSTTHYGIVTFYNSSGAGQAEYFPKQFTVEGYFS